MSKVLIGIPTLNGPERLERVLFSVKEHTRDAAGKPMPNVTVLVSDDCSSEENLEANKEVAARYGVDMLMTDKRLGISCQWNRLVRHVPDADIVVLLNDDVEVVRDWLDVLVFSLEKNPILGMVGLLSEAGTKAECAPRPRLDFAEASFLHGNGTLLSSVGACFAFRRADWLAVGGFDERYFAYYEEVDFGVMLAKERGLVHAMATYPVIYHMVGATMKNLGAQKILEQSRAEFTKKWKQTLDELREEFGRLEVPPLKRWHSQWKYWRHP
jgi:GT2 family glycosyltransferase